MQNLISFIKNQRRSWAQLWQDTLAAMIFYTCIPLPISKTLDFHSVARLAPAIGLLIGAILGLVDAGIRFLGMPVLTASALAVAFWLVLTGGLHLDGAMDTADGLAVQNPQRRLQVMADSATGAFGAMAVVILLLLKTTALTDLDSRRWLALMAASGWGRWGQQVAIAQYPYLKAVGKGAIHQDAIRSPLDLLPGLLLLLSLNGLQVLQDGYVSSYTIGTSLGGMAIAILCGAFFNHQLGGHTGDTYGAVVEWTEALLLCLLTAL